MQIETPDPNSRTPKWAWLFLVFLGLLAITLGIFTYDDLRTMEEQGGSIKINWLVAVVYHIFGKLGVAVSMVLVGAGFFRGAYRCYVEAREQ